MEYSSFATYAGASGRVVGMRKEGKGSFVAPSGRGAKGMEEIGEPAREYAERDPRIRRADRQSAGLVKDGLEHRIAALEQDTTEAEEEMDGLLQDVHAAAASFVAVSERLHSTLDVVLPRPEDADGHKVGKK